MTKTLRSRTLLLTALFAAALTTHRADAAPENLDPTLNGTGKVTAAIVNARVLVQVDGARRANSFNYYKQQQGVDPESVKLINTEGTQQTFENLPVGATLAFTVTGVNDAGEGQPSAPVEVVVT